MMCRRLGVSNVVNRELCWLLTSDEWPLSTLFAFCVAVLWRKRGAEGQSRIISVNLACVSDCYFLSTGSFILCFRVPRSRLRERVEAVLSCSIAHILISDE